MLCALVVVGIGIPLSLVLTPLLYALTLVGVHLAGLVVPLPPALWCGLRAVGSSSSAPTASSSSSPCSRPSALAALSLLLTGLMLLALSGLFSLLR